MTLASTSPSPSFDNVSFLTRNFLIRLLPGFLRNPVVVLGFLDHVAGGVVCVEEEVPADFAAS